MYKVWLAICLFVAFGANAWAGAVTIPNAFTAGTTSSAAQVNANFTAVKTAVDDNDTRVTALEAAGGTACPAGFTDVSAAGNQLGCMQTAEQPTTATWEDASNTCFTTFGGRLPTTGEWYITMINFVLTAEVDNWEWNDDANALGVGNMHAVSGGVGIIINQTPAVDTTLRAYRCWIPR